MTRFCITFGQKYGHEAHPALGERYYLPEGWMTIEAESDHDARVWLRDNIGNRYSSIYPERKFFDGRHDEWYPMGYLGDIRGAIVKAVAS